MLRVSLRFASFFYDLYLRKLQIFTKLYFSPPIPSKEHLIDKHVVEFKKKKVVKIYWNSSPVKMIVSDSRKVICGFS